MDIKNLIYLDIDGVMCLPNNDLSKDNYLLFNDYSLDILKTLLSFKDTFIVISSSWKEYKTIDYLKEVVFSQYGLSDFILDKTDDLCINDDDCCREDEIYLFMKKYKTCNHLILDDLSLNFSEYDLSPVKGNFLNYRIDGKIGLCLNDLKYLNIF